MNAPAQCWQSSTGSGFFGAPLFVPDGFINVLKPGTGGHLNERIAQQYPGLNATTPDRSISRATAKDTVLAPAAQSLAERVSAIKAAFGLTISQLAQVLQVQRQTIYDWVDEENPRQIQEQKRERLVAIQRLAVQWNQLCSWPAGKGIATYTVDGDALLDLLSADVLDESRLQPMMRSLSEQVKAEWQRREERSLAYQLRTEGFQPVPDQSLRSVLAGYGGTVSLTHDD
jgi:hypothetical protein